MHAWPSAERPSPRHAAETATVRRRNRPFTRMPGDLHTTPRRRPRTTTPPSPRTMRSTGRPRITRMSPTIRLRRHRRHRVSCLLLRRRGRSWCITRKPALAPFSARLSADSSARRSKPRRLKASAGGRMSSRRRTSADRLHRSVCRPQLIVAWYSWSDLTSPFPLMAASMPSAAA